MTNDKGHKFGPNATPPITEPTQQLPAQPAPAAPSPAAPVPAPAAPIAVTPAAPTPTAAPAAHVGRRPRHSRHAAHPVTPAHAPASADDEPEGSEETEQTPPSDAAVAAAKKQILKEAAEKKEKRKLKNRAKRAPKAFLAWLSKWCKKHWFISSVIVVVVIGWLAISAHGMFFADGSVASSEPRKVAPARISPGTGGERAEDSEPTIVDDGDAKVLTYTDPSFSDATFDVIVDNDLNIIEVKLGDKLKNEYGGRLSIGTTNTTEDDVRCTKTSQSCDFSKEKISICKSWLWLNRSVHNGPQSSNGEQPYWSPREVFDAQLDPSRVYPGDTDTTPQLCGTDEES